MGKTERRVPTTMFGKTTVGPEPVASWSAIPPMVAVTATDLGEGEPALLMVHIDLHHAAMSRNKLVLFPSPSQARLLAAALIAAAEEAERET